ncbi:pentapeptide repeat-containing protein [Fulvivirgaceae bacterium LMO-SS25]
MNKQLIEGETFSNINYTENLLAKGDYENCQFTNCNLSSVDLSNINFTECTFDSCNLSMCKLGNTGIKDVTFNDCKMLGLHFQNCNEFLFEIEINNCQLNLSSFYRRKLKKTNFRNSVLHEVDFAEADLSMAVFDNCDLQGAIFENTILEKVDFRTAKNYSINPELNRIRKAKFSIPEVVGLLNKYDITIQ